MLLNKDGFKFLKNRLSNREKADLILNKKMLIDISERLNVIEKKLDSYDSSINCNNEKFKEEVSNCLDILTNQITSTFDTENEDVNYLLRRTSQTLENLKDCSPLEVRTILEITTILAKFTKGTV